MAYMWVKLRKFQWEVFQRNKWLYLYTLSFGASPFVRLTHYLTSENAQRDKIARDSSVNEFDCLLNVKEENLSNV